MQAMAWLIGRINKWNIAHDLNQWRPWKYREYVLSIAIHTEEDSV